MQTLIVRKKYNKSEPFRQGKKQGTNGRGLIHIRQALKSLVVEWRCRGVLPERVVEKIFKVMDLRGA